MTHESTFGLISNKRQLSYSNTSKFSFPLKIASNTSIHGNAVYEQKSELKRNNQHVRNAISEITNVKCNNSKFLLYEDGAD